MKRIIAFAAAMIMCLTIACTVFAEGSVAYVNAPNGKSVNVRSSTITHCNNQIDALPVSTEVTVLRTEGDWSYIRFTSTKNAKKTLEGYMMSRYLTTNKTTAIKNTVKNMTAVTPYRVTVNPSNPSGYVNRRQYPTKESRVTGRYYQGQSVTIVEENSTWAKIYDPATKTDGYMMLRFLKK